MDQAFSQAHVIPGVISKEQHLSSRQDLVFDKVRSEEKRAPADEEQAEEVGRKRVSCPSRQPHFVRRTVRLFHLSGQYGSWRIHGEHSTESRCECLEQNFFYSTKKQVAPKNEDALVTKGQEPGQVVESFGWAGDGDVKFRESHGRTIM